MVEYPVGDNMLIIRKVLDYNLKEELCKECGVPNYENSMAYLAIESATPEAYEYEKLALLQFSLKNGCAYINQITTFPNIVDNEALIIMSRAAMEFIYRSIGISILKIEDNPYTMEILIEVLGFRRDSSGVYTIDLAKFFEEPCKFDPDK